MANEEKSIGEWFEDIFGKDERSAEERAEDQRRRDHDRNFSAEREFEKERDRRSEYLHMDQRIRSIVSSEINKLIVMGVVIAGIYGAGSEYGWPAGAAVLVVASAILWWEDRKQKKRPSFMIEEVDRLAKDTVTHELIVAHEREGKPWLWVDGEDLFWGEFFGYPFWDNVNKRVRSYVSMPHPDRIRDNKAAREASLPYRRAFLAKLREQHSDWGLPYWAEIDFEERKSQ